MNAGVARTSALVLALELACVLPAAAQTTDGGTTGATGTTSNTGGTDTTTVRRDRDDRSDWGWLGLLGLAGLAGLRRKPEGHDTHRSSTTATR
jgi:MYXO-CTERM domain-containing protein